METARVLEMLKAVVRDSVSERKAVAVAYSGGLDSSLIAKLASEFTRTVCYTCAAKGSIDASRARESGKSDGFDVRVLQLTEQDLPSIVKRASKVLATTDPVRIAYTIPTFLVIERCEEDSVLAGNGADELFGGYEKYSRSPGAYASELETDLRRSVGEAARLDAHARTMGRRALFPFLHGQFIELSLTIPIEQKINHDSRKVILRDAAKLMGLAAANRPKKAAQYSSGSLKLMKSCAKKENVSLQDWTISTVSGNEVGKD